MLLFGPEIALNGWFEDDAADPTSWYRFGSGVAVTSFYVTDDYPFAGDNHAWFKTFSYAAPGYAIRCNPPTMIIAGERYRISAAISPDSGSYMAAQITNSAYSMSIGLNKSFIPETTAVPSWHLYNWDFLCTVSDYPSLVFVMPDAAPKIALFDAVSLRRKIEISASYDYKNTRTLDRIITRNVGGSLRIYTGPGEHRKFSVPVSWVTSKDACAINSWWETGATIGFMEKDVVVGSYSINSYYNVRIVGEQQPLNQYQHAHFGEYLTGTLEMETV